MITTIKINNTNINFEKMLTFENYVRMSKYLLNRNCLKLTVPFIKIFVLYIKKKMKINVQNNNI